MPRIEYPNVPQAPGVPAVSRRETYVTDEVNIVQATTAPSLLALFNGTIYPAWGVYTPNGGILIQADAVARMDYNNESVIADFPIEGGEFYSYNKVSTPYSVRLTLAKGFTLGSLTNRSDFLESFEALLRPAPVLPREIGDEPNYYDLSQEVARNQSLYVDIVTPDAVYLNVQLVRYNYNRQSRSGVTLLTVDAMFREVRMPIATQDRLTAEPSGADTVNKGNGIASEPNVDQQAEIDKDKTDIPDPASPMQLYQRG